MSENHFYIFASTLIASALVGGGRGCDIAPLRVFRIQYNVTHL